MRDRSKFKRPRAQTALQYPANSKASALRNQVSFAMQIARRATPPAGTLAGLLLASQAHAANFSPSDVADLIAAINTANGNGEDDVIDLGGNTFTLTAIDNTSIGDNGLPSITESGHTLTIQNGTIERDTGAVDTFRIFRVAVSGTLELVETTLTGGVADGNSVGEYDGGAILNQGELSLLRSTISGNTATRGGAIRSASLGKTTIITNSTLSGNSAENRGGAISGALATVHLDHATVVDNSSSGDGGGIHQDAGSVTLTSSLIAGNRATGSGDEIASASGTGPTADASNLFGHSDITNAEAFAGFTPGVSDITATSDGSDPTPLSGIVVGLADNGGPTETHTLRTNGPAVDAVDAVASGCPGPATDQRGTTRALDGDGAGGPACDIGAVEIDPVTDAEIIVTPGAVDDNYANGNCSLVEAIISANSDLTPPGSSCVPGSDADVIVLDGSTFTLDSVNNSAYGPTGLPLISSDIAMFGNGATITRDPSAAEFRIATISGSGTFRLHNSTMSNGDTDGYGGAIYNRFGSLALYWASLENNLAQRGGGMYGQGTSRSEIFDSTISGNSAARGGGIAQRSGNLTIAETTISGNSAQVFGGGGYLSGVDSSITNGTVSNNEAQSGGGLDSSGTLSLHNSVISDNTATRAGGVDLTGQVSITQSTISGNSAADDGGGVFLSGLLSTLTLQNSLVSGNAAGGDVGGIAIQSNSTATIQQSTIADNTATNGIGGIQVALNSQALIEESTIADNTSNFSCGGLFISGGSTGTINNSTISANATNTSGCGGVGVVDSTASVANSTVTGNSAGGDGGGFYVATIYGASGYLSIGNTTITSNTADQGGGVVVSAYSDDATLVLGESLIAGNSASPGDEVVAESTGGSARTFADAFNLFGHAGLTNAQAFSGFTPGASDINATSNGTNTPLGLILNTTLADNGGPTQTHMLPFGSPAIDAVDDGSCPPPATDQRGEGRPVDGDDSSSAECDIGAVEYDPSTADSDADGITDAYEIDNELNPNLADAGDDKDMDGVTNGDEFNADTEANDPDSDDDDLGDAVDNTPLVASNACIDDNMGPAGAKAFDDTAMSGMTTQCGSESQITVRGTAILEMPDATLELFAPTVIFDTGFNVPLGTQLGVDSSDPTPP